VVTILGLTLSRPDLTFWLYLTNIIIQRQLYDVASRASEAVEGRNLKPNAFGKYFLVQQCNKQPTGSKRLKELRVK
jgi:hypothetical protein